MISYCEKCQKIVEFQKTRTYKNRRQYKCKNCSSRISKKANKIYKFRDNTFEFLSNVLYSDYAKYLKNKFNTNYMSENATSHIKKYRIKEIRVKERWI